MKMKVQDEEKAEIGICKQSDGKRRNSFGQAELYSGINSSTIDCNNCGWDKDTVVASDYQCYYRQSISDGNDKAHPNGLPLPDESDRNPSCSVSCIRGNDGKNERRSHYRKSKPVKSNSLKHLLLFKLTSFSPNAWNMVSIYIHFLTLTPKENKCSALMYHR